MRQILLPAILLFPAALIAQPVIGQSAFANVVGLTYELTTSTPVALGSAGANVTWDYSQLTTVSTTTIENLDVATSGIGDIFPEATFFTNDQTLQIALARQVAADGLYSHGA